MTDHPEIPSQPYLEKWDQQIVEAHRARDDLATMLRRMMWLIDIRAGDTSLKALSGKAKQLLAKHGLEGSLLRDDA